MKVLAYLGRAVRRWMSPYSIGWCRAGLYSLTFSVQWETTAVVTTLNENVNLPCASFPHSLLSVVLPCGYFIMPVWVPQRLWYLRTVLGMASRDLLLPSVSFPTAWETGLQKPLPCGVHWGLSPSSHRGPLFTLYSWNSSPVVTCG